MRAGFTCAGAGGGRQQWLKVGLRLKADANGVLDFRLENDETERNGNDFAIDDMKISNDPTIVNGANRMIIE
jgi:hypothetical protein